MAIDPVCRHCGKIREGTTKHIKFGNDLDNPVKHEFEPIEVDWATLTDELAAALRLALVMFSKGHCIGAFDWGKSSLSAENIQELNETPGKLRSALARWEQAKTEKGG